jgi:hypothetical protein
MMQTSMEYHAAQIRGEKKRAMVEARFGPTRSKKSTEHIIEEDVKGKLKSSK